MPAPAPSYSQYNGSLEAIKWLALFAMAYDHIGFIYYDIVDYHLYRAIGRLTLTLLFWVIGVRLAEKPERAAGYLKRLIPWAIVSQPIYWLCFDSSGGRVLWDSMLNIFFTIAVGTGVFMLMHKGLQKPGWQQRVPWLLGALLLSGLASWPRMMDYGMLGALMIPALALAARRSLPASALIAGVLGSITTTYVMYPRHDATMMQIVIFMPLVAGLLAWLSLQIRWEMPRLPRWSFYLFYPLHLTVLLLVRVIYFPVSPTP